MSHLVRYFFLADVPFEPLGDQFSEDWWTPCLEKKRRELTPAHHCGHLARTQCFVDLLGGRTRQCSRPNKAHHA